MWLLPASPSVAYMLVSDGNRLAHHLKGLSCRQQLSSRSRATAKCHASEAALKQEVTSTPWDAQMPLSLGARTVFARLMKSFSLTPATHVLTTACTTNLKTLKLICSRLLERLGEYSVCVCEREFACCGVFVWNTCTRTRSSSFRRYWEELNRQGLKILFLPHPFRSYERSRSALCLLQTPCDFTLSCQLAKPNPHRHAFAVWGDRNWSL